MKRYLLAGVSLLALAAAAPEAEAAPFTFSYTGKMVEFVVPDTGLTGSSPTARRAVTLLASPGPFTPAARAQRSAVISA